MTPGRAMLPGALVIGPMKAGTTWIHDYLAWRGDVRLPSGVKETFYFDRHFDRGADWYARHFRAPSPGTWRATVEVAPSLFHAADAPRRVAETLGPVPLVVTLRDPVRRAWSHYQHLRRKGYIAAPLVEACRRHPEILDASRYDQQIARWRAALPDAPLAILRLEDLGGDRAAFVAALCEALNLPYRAAPETLTAANEAGVPPSFLLARLGNRTATALRSAGGYGAVNLAKRLGLKRLFFGAASARARRIEPTPADTAFLHQALGDAAPVDADAGHPR